MNGRRQGPLRVSFLCQWFPPEPAPIPWGIAAAMQRTGARVRVLTGIPNYPTGRVPDGYRASRSISEVVEGLPVRRTPLYPSHDARPGRRFANYVSWAASSTMFGSGVLRRSDVCLVYASPATAALAAMWARLTAGVPYVLMIQDVWPDSVLASNMLPRGAERPLRRLLEIFVGISYRWASAIVVISPGMKDLLVARGVPSGKVEIVYNWVEPSEPPHEQARSRWRAELGISERDFVLMYAGNHGTAQDLSQVIQGFLESRTRRPATLLMVGDGLDKAALVREAAEHTDRIRFLDRQPKERMADLMAAADVQVVSLADRPLFAITTPSKIQSVFESGHPVLVCARGDAARIVGDAGAGRAVVPGDPVQFGRAVDSLEALSAVDLAALGNAGKQFFDRHLSESIGAKRLREILLRAADDPRGRHSRGNGKR